jgi:hypothetical protein
MEKFIGGYRDRAGIDSRANALMCALSDIIGDVNVPPAVRLVRIAERMAEEPILTDDSSAAYGVRAEAARLNAIRERMRDVRRKVARDGIAEFGDAADRSDLTSYFSAAGGHVDLSAGMPGPRGLLHSPRGFSHACA